MIGTSQRVSGPRRRRGIAKAVVDGAARLHGLCVDGAEVFAIGDDGELRVLNETPPEGLREKVDKALRAHRRNLDQ